MIRTGTGSKDPRTVPYLRIPTDPYPYRIRNRIRIRRESALRIEARFPAAF